jgi:hypothetical protein
MTRQPRKNSVAREVDNLERILARLAAEEQRKFVNEDVLRLEKNGDLSYECIRTTAVSQAPAEPIAPPHQQKHQAPPAPHCLPDNLPDTPAPSQTGNLIASLPADPQVHPAAAPTAEPDAGLALAAASGIPGPPAPLHQPAPISCHEGQIAGNQLADASGSSPLPKAPSPSQDPDPLEELLLRAMAVAHVRRGRPPAFDDHAKGQLVALLAVGMSMRQAAAVLGVSHTTVQNTLKADAALASEITAARFQAQLQPLACVIREARRSWKAATWLLKYLDAKIASHDETPDERRDRQQREADEFMARHAQPGVKQRRELA